MNKLSSIKIPRWLTVSCAYILLLAVLWISNSIFSYIPVLLQVVSYILLLITIYCCYEAYFKIRRNKGYIYITIICLLLILPGVIQGITAIFAPHPAIRTESVMQRCSNESTEASYDRPAVININMEIHLPLIELLLLLAVLKFSIKDDEDKVAENAPANPASPDSNTNVSNCCALARSGLAEMDYMDGMDIMDGRVKTPSGKCFLDSPVVHLVHSVHLVHHAGDQRLQPSSE